MSDNNFLLISIYSDIVLAINFRLRLQPILIYAVLVSPAY